MRREETRSASTVPGASWRGGAAGAVGTGSWPGVMTVPELETRVAVPRASRSQPPNRRVTGVVGVVVAGSALAVLTLLLSTLALLGHRTTPGGWLIVGMAALLAVGELPLAEI